MPIIQPDKRDAEYVCGLHRSEMPHVSLSRERPKTRQRDDQCDQVIEPTAIEIVLDTYPYAALAHVVTWQHVKERLRALLRRAGVIACAAHQLHLDWPVGMRSDAHEFTAVAHGLLRRARQQCTTSETMAAHLIARNR